jgi:hypothetical protein
MQILWTREGFEETIDGGRTWDDRDPSTATCLPLRGRQVFAQDDMYMNMIGEN